jgi:Thymidylate synthase
MDYEIKKRTAETKRFQDDGFGMIDLGDESTLILAMRYTIAIPGQTGVTGKPLDIGSYTIGLCKGRWYYALPTDPLAQARGLDVGDFVDTFGDAHLYSNRHEREKLQLSRAHGPLPRLKTNPAPKNLFDFDYDDIVFEDYLPRPAIKAPVAV